MNQTNKKPEWLKQRVTNMEQIQETVDLLEKLSLHTVCDSAGCPNLPECFGNKTATFMILGNVCTRICGFCAVNKGAPETIDTNEPANIGRACKELGLKHIVVTSVTRDDLADGGAQHFAHTTLEIKKQNPSTTIELLIPDLQGNWDALKTILDTKPDILNHNIETVEDLYSEIRPIAKYRRSLDLLKKSKELDPTIYTKSGIMVGLGEKDDQVYTTMDDLREVDCDILTIGQYMQPSSEHIQLKEYIHPDKFSEYKKVAEGKGFKFVASGPFVRSSYNAALGIQELNTEKNHTSRG